MTNCSNNYGPYHFPEKLIPVVILKALAGAPIPVYGAGENVRDWLYVEDHADALLTVLQKGRVGRSYNIGGENEARNIDLVQTICAHPRRKAPRQSTLFRADHLCRPTAPAMTRAMPSTRPGSATELGWRPSVTLERGAGEDRAMVSRQRGLVARAAEPRRGRPAAGPDGLRRAMPIVRINSKLVYFAHVPKCAGSAVERYLAARFGPLGFLDSTYLKMRKSRRWNNTFAAAYRRRGARPAVAARRFSRRASPWCAIRSSVCSACSATSAISKRTIPEEWTFERLARHVWPSCAASRPFQSRQSYPSDGGFRAGRCHSLPAGAGAVAG